MRWWMLRCIVSMSPTSSFSIFRSVYAHEAPNRLKSCKGGETPWLLCWKRLAARQASSRKTVYSIKVDPQSKSFIHGRIKIDVIRNSAESSLLSSKKFLQAPDSQVSGADMASDSTLAGNAGVNKLPP
jgi:hypothetical protein